jgi:hypothetical protein
MRYNVPIPATVHPMTVVLFSVGTWIPIIVFIIEFTVEYAMPTME